MKRLRRRPEREAGDAEINHVGRRWLQRAAEGCRGLGDYVSSRLESSFRLLDALQTDRATEMAEWYPCSEGCVERGWVMRRMPVDLDWNQVKQVLTRLGLMMVGDV